MGTLGTRAFVNTVESSRKRVICKFWGILLLIALPLIKPFNGVYLDSGGVYESVGSSVWFALVVIGAIGPAGQCLSASLFDKHKNLC